MYNFERRFLIIERIPLILSIIILLLLFSRTSYFRNKIISLSYVNNQVRRERENRGLFLQT